MRSKDFKFRYLVAELFTITVYHEYHFCYYFKESELAKLIREVEGIKNDSRDKDLRLQSLQAKVK